MSPLKHHFVTVSCLLFGLALGPAPAVACNAEVACPVAEGSYLVRPPSVWDGRAMLPVIVFFHGAFSDAKDTMARVDLRKAADDVGALLVAADGLNKNWSFPGKQSNARDDFAYVAHVLDDVERRFPVDKTALLASGFSVGGSMTWYVACFLAARFTAFAPVAGAYWEPLPQTCPSGPVSLRHVHGLADPTVPMKGRSLRGGQFKQGDVLESFRRLRARAGCGETPDKVETRGDMTCQMFSAKTCSSGREVVLCLHPGEHEVAGEWVADGFRWMKALAKSATP
jgi:polyhydroxybutyrate depolymerase